MRIYDKDAEVLAFHGKTVQDLLFRDMYGNNGYVGSIVATDEESDIVYEIVANDDMTDIMEMSTYIQTSPDGSGQSLEYAVIYCMPVISVQSTEIAVIYSVQ